MRAKLGEVTTVQRDQHSLKKVVAWRFAGTRSLQRMTQQDFADRFGLTYSQALDIEHARSLPSMATRTLLEAIRLDPELVARAAESAREHYGMTLNKGQIEEGEG